MICPVCQSVMLELLNGKGSRVCPCGFTSSRPRPPEAPDAAAKPMPAAEQPRAAQEPEPVSSHEAPPEPSCAWAPPASDAAERVEQLVETIVDKIARTARAVAEIWG